MKIGDKVTIKDKRGNYSYATDLFRTLGFKNPIKNKTLNSAIVNDVFTVFCESTHPLLKTSLLGIENEKGDQHLFDAACLKLINSMNKKEINKDRIVELYQNEKNKTEVARKYAKECNISYSDSFRKKVSDILTSNNYFEAVSKLSALKEDNTIMSISEYCDFYKIPLKEVRTYKLVTHTGKGAYYNITSNNVESQDYADFHKKILEDLSNIKTLPKDIVRNKTDKETYLLVIDPADIHIGKLSDSFETGESYNNQIAVKRVHEGIEGILDKIKGFTIDKILFVGGNDILHIDSPKRTTTSGTYQDTEGMWYSNFLIAKQLYINILLRLLEVADIRFVYNPSNHDYVHGFFLADVIQTYFRNCENITFDCSIAHRKYYTYYNNLIGTTHGDGAKTIDLPLLMAQESPDWSKTKNRYIYTHHVHHKNSKDFVGVTVESLRSPSGTDSWHHRNGFQHSPKAIEGFLHSKEHGQIARITHLF